MSISCVLQARHADIQPAAVHILDSMRDAESQVDKGRVCVSERARKKKRGAMQHVRLRAAGEV